MMQVTFFLLGRKERAGKKGARVNGASSGMESRSFSRRAGKLL
jgi:hypothetical protein